MTSAPSAGRQLGMLQRLRSGLVLAGPDNPVLRHLQLRRHVRAIPLYDSRTGKPLPAARAWQITDAGIAAAIGLAAPRPRSRSSEPVLEQVDLEEHLAATAAPDTGRQPEAATRPVPEAPAVLPAGVSAPEGRPSRRAADRQPGARGQKPETIDA